MGFFTNAAGDINLIFLAVKFHGQAALTAVALYFCVGGGQSEHGTGPHHGLAALGTEIAKSPHFFVHYMHLILERTLSFRILISKYHIIAQIS